MVKKILTSQFIYFKIALVVLFGGLIGTSFGQELSLEDSVLSTNEMKLVMKSITDENPELKDRPMYLNTLEAKADDTRYLVTLFRFTDLPEEQLFLLLSKAHKNQKFTIMGKILLNDMVKIKSGLSYAMFPTLFPLTDDEFVVALVEGVVHEDSLSQRSDSKAILVKLGRPSEVVGYLPYGCYSRTTKCDDSDAAVCEYIKQRNVIITSGRKKNGHYNYTLDFNIYRKVAVDGEEDISKETARLTYYYDKLQKTYVTSGNPSKYACWSN